MTKVNLRCLRAICLALLATSCTKSPEAAKRNALQQADRFYRDGKYTDSAIRYRKVVQAHPDCGEAYLGVGRSEEKLGRLRPAFDALTRAAGLMANSSEARAELADVGTRIYLSDPRHPAGLYQQLTNLANDLVAKDPESFAGFRLQGYLALSDGNLSKAIADFEKADSLRSDQPDVVTVLVQARFEMGESKIAEARALAFLGRNETYAPIYDVLYSYYAKSGQDRAAEDILKAKVDANPNVGTFRTQLAEHYWRTNRRQDVADCIAELTAKIREIPDAYVKAGDFYARFREWDQAAQQYEAGLKAFPKDDAEYLTRIAGVRLRQGKQDEAQKALESVLQKHPDDRGALAARASIFASSGRPGNLDRAIADFRALLLKDPSSLVYQVPLAGALRQKGDFASAKAQFLAIVQRNASYVPALQALAELFLRDQQFDDASRFADRVLAIDPKNASARLVRSACQAISGDYPNADRTLQALIHDFPHLKQAEMQLALLRLTQKRYKEAENLFHKDYKPGTADVRNLTGLVQVYRAENRPQEALHLVEREQHLSPQSVEVRKLLAGVAQSTGNLDLALEQYRDLIAATPGSPELWIQMGLVYQAKGDLSHAVESFETAGRLAQNNPLPPALIGKLLENDKPREAIAAYRRSLSIRPDDPSVINNLAYLLAETGLNLDEALTLAQSAIRKQPNNASFADTAGWIYFKKGNTASALHILEGLAQREPANPSIRLHLATVLIATGDSTAARKELLVGLSAHPSQIEEKQIREKMIGIQSQVVQKYGSTGK